MLDAERLAAIRAARPFRLVADEDLGQLAEEVALIEVAAGSTVFEEGDPADGVSSIVEGTIEITAGRRVLATLGTGAVIGELSLFVPTAARTATARATSDVAMLTWRANDVSGRLLRHERLATAIVADLASVLAERLDRRTRDVVSLLNTAGTRLPVSELERLRGRVLQ